MRDMAEKKYGKVAKCMDVVGFWLVSLLAFGNEDVKANA